MNLEDDGISNPTNNRPFEDIMRSRLSRRGVMAGGLATAGAFMASGAMAGVAAAEGPSGRKGNGGGKGNGNGGGAKARPVIGFDPVPVADANGPEVVISSDYMWAPLIPWGTPIRKGVPAFSWPPTDPEAAENQIGIGHDGMWYFGDDKGGMLCINHEFGRTPHVLGKDLPENADDVRIMQAVHGVSCVRIVKKNGSWTAAASNKNRRIHGNTPVTFSGPVATSRRGNWLGNNAKNPYLGTLNNCANGYTPWGTYLTCEENFNGYFGTEDPDWNPGPRDRRYGISNSGFGYGWHLFDPRFDVANKDYFQERNRFGWVVEIDPDDPEQVPVKRTALGRFKHEGATVVEGKGGRVAVYMGDDERFDYIYKYVSKGNWASMLARGKSPLDEGTLYVAKYNDDGTGAWLPLTMDNPALAGAFRDQAELLTFTREAADIVGATPMDRPEWSSAHPDGSIYFTLTNNSRRTEPNAPNPLAPNPDGHIIRMVDNDGHVGDGFAWEIFLLSQDTHGTEDAFGSPDGLWIDEDGRIFIETDGRQPDGMNDQLLVADDQLEIRRLLSGPNGCEITGVAISPDRRTLFANVQHPGNGDPTETNFPAPTDGTTVPRDATMVIMRKDGGIVGS